VNDYLRKVYVESLGYEAARSQTFAEHARIADAVESGSPEQAASAAREHLSRILDSTETLLAKNKSIDDARRLEGSNE